MSKAAILRLLRFTNKYNMTLKKNESVAEGTMEINLHPSDYERESGKSFKVSVFDTLSKTHLLLDTTANVSSFLGRWRKKGLRAAVKGVEVKYDLPEDPTDRALLERIDNGMIQLLDYLEAKKTGNVGPKTEVGEKAGNGVGDKEVGERKGTGKKTGTEEKGEEGKNGNGNGGNGIGWDDLV